MEVLLADMMVHPVNATFQVGKIAFNPIRSNAQAILIAREYAVRHMTRIRPDPRTSVLYRH